MIVAILIFAALAVAVMIPAIIAGALVNAAWGFGLWLAQRMRRKR